jgi:hypothetical protein
MGKLSADEGRIGFDGERGKDMEMEWDRICRGWDPLTAVVWPVRWLL